MRFRDPTGLTVIPLLSNGISARYFFGASLNSPPLNKYCFMQNRRERRAPSSSTRGPKFPALTPQIPRLTVSRRDVNRVPFFCICQTENAKTDYRKNTIRGRLFRRTLCYGAVSLGAAFVIRGNGGRLRISYTSGEPLFCRALVVSVPRPSEKRSNPIRTRRHLPAVRRTRTR